MFGSLRLALALAVALSHAGVAFWGRHIGVPAVVIFYLLSGYVVANLLDETSALAGHPWRFYRERALRLLPQYFFFLAAGLLAWVLLIPSPYLQGNGTVGQWLANLLIIPLNFFMFAPTLESFVLVPPAWSLGLEMQFYLLAPWLLRKPSRMLLGIVATLMVHGAAALGYLHPDWYGYRLLCGNLFIFLAGAWVYRWHQGGGGGRILIALWLGAAALLLISGSLVQWGILLTLEVQFGFLLGLPLLAGLASLKRRPWDEQLGHLAYGVFLAHFFVLWLAPHIGWLNPQIQPLWRYAVLVIAAGALGHLLAERPLIARRRRMRQAQAGA